MSNQKQLIYWVIAGAMVFIIVQLFGGFSKAIRGITDLFGLTDSEEEQELEEDYEGGAETATISDADALTFANQLYNAHGVWDDDEEAIYRVFNSDKVRSAADIYKIGLKLNSQHNWTLTYWAEKVDEAKYWDTASDGTKDEINRILRSRNINYQF